MSCRRTAYKQPLHEEIAKLILSRLEEVAKIRKQEHPEEPRISVARQTDDPEKPEIIKVDADYPLSGVMAAQNHYIIRLEIDKKTGAAMLYPDGYHADEKKRHAFQDLPDILYRMAEMVRTAPII